MVIQKVKDPVEMDKKLDLSLFLSTDESAGKSGYQIQSVIHHLGSTASSGHYTTDAIRRQGDKDAWVSFDDGTTASIHLDKMLDSERKQRSAYLVLYRLGED